MFPKANKRSEKMGNIRDLQTQLKRALNMNNKQRAIEIYVELGETYRHRGNSPELSIDSYKNAANLAEQFGSYEDAAYSYRAIAEISVDSTIMNNKEGIEYGMKYLHAAKKSNCVHLIQLAYHVLGWLYLQVYINSEVKEIGLLKKSKRWCERGLDYLIQNAVSIDHDENAVKIGQNSRCRKARLRQLMSQVYDKLNLKVEALQHHNAAIAYAIRANDNDLHYRCLLSKLNFFGENRLKTAVELLHIASNLDLKSRAEAKFIVAQEKIRGKDFEGAKWDFISLLSSKMFEKLEVEDRDIFFQSMVVVYKVVERLKKVKELSKSDAIKIYEKLADEFYEIDSREVSLHFYGLMMNYAETTSDQIKALISLAETSKDLERYNDAYEYFLSVQRLEDSNLCLSAAKKAETTICIANAAVNVKSLPHSKKEQLFIAAKEVAVANQQKIDLLESYLSYLELCNGFDDDIARIRMEVRDLKQNSDEKLENDIHTESNDFCDTWDDMSADQIIEKCYSEASIQSMTERLGSEKNRKINSYGETRLHEVARGGLPELLQAMIKMGYEINARDEGGWTPLHEAVGALRLENVSVLLKNGARVDIQSNEGTLSAEGDLLNAGGLTPLMEACDRGCIAIARLLLQYNANTSFKSRDGWLAVDFLKNAISSDMVDDEEKQDAEILVKLLEEKTILQIDEDGDSGGVVNSNIKRISGCNSLWKDNDVPINPTRSAIERNPNANLLDDIDEIDYSKAASDGSILASDMRAKRTIFDYNLYPKLSFSKCAPESSENHENYFLGGSSTKRKKRRFHPNPTTNEQRGGKFAVLESSGEESIVAPSTSQESIPKNDCEIDISVEERSFSNSCDQSVKVQNRMSLPLNEEIALIFLKVQFEQADGSVMMMKGIPFKRSSTVGELRARCTKELESVGSYEALSIVLDGCEITDDMPISLIINNSNNVVICRMSGWQQHSPAGIYRKNTDCEVDTIVKALKASASGSLCLSDMKVGCNIAVCTALQSFSNDGIIEFDISGNALSNEFLEVINQKCPFLVDLNLSCCSLEGRNLRFLLLNDGSIYLRLKKLNLSFNDIGNVSNSSYVLRILRLCSCLTSLSLAGCDISPTLLHDLIQIFKEMNYLEFLDLSHNECVVSQHAVEIIQSCKKLTELHLDATGVDHLNIDVGCNRIMEGITFAMCDIMEPPDWLMNVCSIAKVIDLSATAISLDHLNKISKRNAAKEVITVTKLVLQGCAKIESDVLGFAYFINSLSRVDCALKFELGEHFYREAIIFIMNSHKSLIM